jgi:hypothetical protein
MKAAHVVAVISIIGLAAAGCSRQAEKRVATATPPEGPQDALRVVEARWAGGAELSRAVWLASNDPLVARTISAVADPRLRLERAYAIRAAGVTASGLRCAVTLLPYGRAEDPTWATFAALMERGAARSVQSFDLIVGREPTVLEPGFSAVELATGRRGWIREHGALAPDGQGGPNPAPERFNLTRWGSCFFALAPGWCDAGSKIAQEAAPGVPWAGAVGCGAGVAAAAVACVAGANE